MDRSVDGRPIAVARVLLAVALGINSVEVFVVLSRVANGSLNYPTFSFLPGPSTVAVYVWLGLSLLAATYLLVGLGAGLAAATGAALSAAALIWDQQTYSSHLFLTTLLLCFLAFAKSDERWSIAARVKGGSKRVPWWPQLLMLTQVSACYIFAALSKINPYFPTGGDLRDWMWADLPMWMYPTMAVGTIVTELVIAVTLWIPRLRIGGVALGGALHLSIVLGMADLNLVLTSFSLSCMSTYWLFLSRPAIFKSKRAVFRTAAGV